MIKPNKIVRTNRKNVYIYINQYGELIIRAPKTLSDNSIYKLVEKYQDWIIEKRNKVLSNRSKIKKYFFQEGEKFFYLGQEVRLKIVSDKDFSRKTKDIMINNEYLLFPERFLDNPQKHLEKFYRNEARRIFKDKVDFYIKKYEELFGEKLNYSNLRISSGEKIVGSCSKNNNLSFSWKLIQTPVEVIDYIVAHEVIHLKEKNHKRSFWQKVIKLKPDYRENIKWLKEKWYYLREFLSND